MTNVFKEGDKVRVVDAVIKWPRGLIGTVTEYNPEDGMVQLTFDDGRTYAPFTSGVELVEKAPNPNTNCLEGIACPKCGHTEDFNIYMSSWIDITDDGTGDHGDTEWGDNSAIQCKACDHEGTVAEFRGKAPQISAKQRRLDGVLSAEHRLNSLWHAARRVFNSWQRPNGNHARQLADLIRQSVIGLDIETARPPVRGETGPALAVAAAGIASMVTQLEVIGRFILEGETPDDSETPHEMTLEDLHHTAAEAVANARSVSEQGRALLNRLGQMIGPVDSLEAHDMGKRLEQQMERDGLLKTDVKPADLVAIVREAVSRERWAFESGAEVNGSDLVEWFSEWRTRASQALAAEVSTPTEAQRENRMHYDLRSAIDHVGIYKTLCIFSNVCEVKRDDVERATGSADAAQPWHTVSHRLHRVAEGKAARTLSHLAPHPKPRRQHSNAELEAAR